MQLTWSNKRGSHGGGELHREIWSKEIMKIDRFEDVDLEGGII